MRTSLPPSISSIPPTFSDLNWVAGFLEGEGTFGGAYRANNQKHPTYMVAAKQVNPDPLIKLSCLLGGTISLEDRAEENNGLNAQPIYIWTTSGDRARGIAMTIYSFMSSKRKAQIKIMMSR